MVRLTAILLLLSAGALAAGAPNVVVILADDLGYGDVGANGARRISTPHIDRLAERGLRFTQGYASANVCSPSRAGLLTGRYAIRSGLGWKVVSATSEHGLPVAEETIAELAGRAGLTSMLIGKWHLGRLPQHSPLEHGFDHFFGVPHSNDMPDFALYEGRERLPGPVDQRLLTSQYTQRAVHFVEETEGPFLLLVSHTFPHIPLYASDRFLGSSQAGLYGDTVQELDWSTGEIIAALQRRGVLDDTLVLFTSDNGPFFEGSAGGLKGGKGNAWEGGYRVPFIAHWPAVIEGGRVTDAMVTNLDLLPTMAQALDVTPAAEVVDGRSLMPLFRGADTTPHEYLYYFVNEEVVGLRSQRWKMLTHAYYTGSLGAFERFDQLPGFAAPYELLLDASAEDGEAYSYAQRHPEVVAEMQAALARARNEFYPLRSRPPQSTYPPSR